MKMGIISVCMALLVGIVGCGGSGSGAGSSSLGILTACTKTGVKSVYLTKIGATNISKPSMKVSSKAFSAQLSDLTQILAYISETGNNEPLVFETSSGKHVILNVTSLKAIKESFIAISFSAMVEFQVEVQDDGGESGETYTFTVHQEVTGKALVDMNSGKVYDLSEYDIQNMLIDNNYIYITKNSFKSLYKIAFNDLSHAIPLNNGDYTPAGTLFYIINNRIVAGDHSFDIDGVAVPKTLTTVLLTNSQSTMTGPGEPFSSAIELIDTRSYPPYIIDNAGKIWGYRFDNSGKYAKFQVSLDDDGNTIVPYYEEFTLGVPLNNPNWTRLYVINGNGNYADHLMVGDQSYYYVKRNVDSGITFEAGTSTFGDSFPGWSGNCATYYNGSIYWVSSSSIYSMNLSQNQLFELYNNPNMLNPVTLGSKYITLTLSNGTLIFYQYTDGVTVGTYALSIGSTTPVLLSQSGADIDQIVELSF